MNDDILNDDSISYDEDQNAQNSTDTINSDEENSTEVDTNDTTSTEDTNKTNKLKDTICTIKGYLKTVNYLDLSVRAFASYFILSLYNLTKIQDGFATLEFPKNISVPHYIVYLIAIFIALSLAKGLVKNLKQTINTDGYFLGTSIMFYGLTTVVKNQNFYYAVGVAIVVSICMMFLINNGYFKEFKTLSSLQSKVVVLIFSGLFVWFVGTLAVYRYLVYTTSCYDFGIFCQMYYYMKESLTPLTTCERNELLSHFAIHFSPIYYLLLPIYAIFSSPKTLLICQVLIVASGVIPLYLICKNLKLSNATTMAMCVVYTFSPALIMSTFFDFHENKFLVPLVLWLLWAIEKGNLPLMYVFMALNLMIKEDSFIYVSSIALFVIFSKKVRFSKKANKEKSLVLHGIIMLVIALVYFFIVSTMMKKYGSGIMEYRYDNIMMNVDEGLLNVVKTILLDPALAISEAFTEDKFLFFLQMTVPLLMLPFATKKISHVFLLIPFFMVNLISDYSYQTQLGYQYVCGVTSLLVYASVLNLSELNCSLKKYVASTSMCISMIIGTMYAYGKLCYYDSFCNNGDRIHRTNQMISLIPQDASVEATTYFIPQLSARDEIYHMVSPTDKVIGNMDFVVLKVGPGEENYVEEELEYLTNNGYEFYNGFDDLMYLFVRSEYIEEHPELKENQRSSPIIASVYK